MKKEKKISEIELVLTVIMVELSLLFVALIWIKFSGIKVFVAINPQIKDVLWAVGNAFMLLGFNFLAINVLSKYIPFFQHLKQAYDEVVILAADVSIFGSLIIAVLSGFVEEIFFRGAVQGQFGIVVASIVFGLFHVGSKKTSYYGIYTVFVGFYLGWLYLSSGNLLLPITVHVLNNFFALPYMKHYYRKNLKYKSTV